MQRDDSNENEKEIRIIDATLGKGKLETPSSNFTHRVMMNLHSMPVASALSPKNGVLLLGGTVVAVTLLTLLMSGGMFDTINQTIALPEVRDIKTSVPISGKWIMKGLIVLNTVLAFILLDRTILRPLFNKRATRI